MCISGSPVAPSEWVWLKFGGLKIYIVNFIVTKFEGSSLKTLEATGHRFRNKEYRGTHKIAQAQLAEIFRNFLIFGRLIHPLPVI